MKHILILGTGKSSWFLLDYLNRNASQGGWRITACDRNVDQLIQQTNQMQFVEAKMLDVMNETELTQMVQSADLVVSMLPAYMHLQIAEKCLEFGKHLATASYVSPELKGLEANIEAKGLIFLNEMGLDPGIDHMSAMKIIDSLQSAGAQITSFESYCGGLISEECCDSDDPWKYKFTWNPMNVVLAGQGGMSVFRKNGVERYVPWHQVFNHYSSVQFPGEGSLDAYPNRDSLKYIELYHLSGAETFIRGTLRRRDFCRAWQVLVDLGFTDNQTRMSESITTPQKLTKALTGKSHIVELINNLEQSNILSKDLVDHILSLDLYNSEFVFSENADTAAQKFCEWLQLKWKLEPGDTDEVLMLHRIVYQQSGVQNEIVSTLKVNGTDLQHTAMAKTVGLTLAIGVEMILNNHISRPGIHIPVTAEWYLPVLEKLAAEGIVFAEW